MAIVTGALIAGGASLVGGLAGDLFSSSSAQQTNENNMAIAQMNNQFNAQQAQLNRNFQQQQTSTAEQTRVQDLQKAGLNPMLAAGQPAQAMPGSQAMSAGLPNLQNPGASFANLGSQVAGAINSGAAVAGTQAQIAKDQAATDLTRMQAMKAAQELPYAAPQAAANVNQTEQNTKTLRSQMFELDSEFDFNTLGKTPLSMQQFTQNQEMFALQNQYQALENQRLRYGMPALAADASFWQGLSPQMRNVMVGIRDIGPGVSSAAGAVSQLGRMIP